MSARGLRAVRAREYLLPLTFGARTLEVTMGRDRNKAGGPTRGRLRVKKMGMGSGRARARARASLRSGKRG
jgi:hypothetical protein